jgi:hypothetical protein
LGDATADLCFGQPDGAELAFGQQAVLASGLAVEDAFDLHAAEPTTRV